MKQKLFMIPENNKNKSKQKIQKKQYSIFNKYEKTKLTLQTDGVIKGLVN